MATIYETYIYETYMAAVAALVGGVAVGWSADVAAKVADAWNRGWSPAECYDYLRYGIWPAARR